MKRTDVEAADHEEAPEGSDNKRAKLATDRLLYKTGSALEIPSASDRTTVVMHVCNDVGKWGRGFVLAVSRVSPAPENAYRQWFRSKKSDEGTPFRLGAVQFVRVNERMLVANMIGQRDIVRRDGLPPHRIEAVRKAVRTVLDRANDEGWDVQCPRIGCSLGGGSWAAVSKMLQEEIERVPSVHITVCTRPEDSFRP
jgi:O-acetyl-ADP-ribose deacetylase (regulator of RNase III)